MIRNVYLIRDTALNAFLIPMFFQSEGAARRAFSDEVNRVASDNIMNAHPEHFQLYFCGSYDDESGVITASPPQFLVDALSVVVQS